MRLRMQFIVVTAALLTAGLGFSTAASSADQGALQDTVSTTISNSTTTFEQDSTPSGGLPAPEVASPTPTPEPTPTAIPEPTPTPTPAPVGPPVYLTFDDGPDPTFTPQLLDVLAAHNAKATFFAQGSQVQAYPELAQRIVAEGHSLQNHAWDHPRLDYMAQDDIVYGQLLPTNDVITQAAGTTPVCMRAPYGANGPTVYGAAAATGMQVVGWHLDPGDYYNPGAQAIAQRVLNNIGVGSIVLLHDAGSGDRQQTVDAVAAILPELSARGLQPAALCQ